MDEHSRTSPRSIDGSPLVLHKVREYAEQGYRLFAWCPKCQGCREVSAARLVMRGKGDKTIPELRIRHRKCGALMDLRIAPPDRDPGRAKAHFNVPPLAFFPRTPGHRR